MLLSRPAGDRGALEDACREPRPKDGVECSVYGVSRWQVLDSAGQLEGAARLREPVWHLAAQVHGASGVRVTGDEDSAVAVRQPMLADEGLSGVEATALVRHSQ
jgi:hypothetical protein